MNLSRGSRKDPNPPVLPAGLYVTAEQLDSQARFEVRTAQGNFSFAAAGAGFGKALTFVGERVPVERVSVGRRWPTGEFI